MKLLFVSFGTFFLLLFGLTAPAQVPYDGLNTNLFSGLTGESKEVNEVDGVGLESGGDFESAFLPSLELKYKENFELLF